MHQDIRPIEIGILNLMPLKEDTELQMLRSLSNSHFQAVDVLLSQWRAIFQKYVHEPSEQVLQTFGDIQNRNLDGLIITGAPVELHDFEEVDYWDELVEIMEWSRSPCDLYFTSAGAHRRGYIITTVSKRRS